MAAVGGAGMLGRRAVRWMLALALGGLWWWSVFRLALSPDAAGPVEGALAVGGWGLSLLPVHCGPSPRRRGGRVTTASRLHHSGAGSGRS
ncbi:hypothetical protein [Streptomyces sp. NA02950]|uniref:hypothetical protein n=1 Tax=Streptomyces sp. NA02950 TaxID=2742137 RepID=UPI0020CABCC1|nr:hypothetical protein [Streptomyces sp. NA02950]